MGNSEVYLSSLCKKHLTRTEFDYTWEDFVRVEQFDDMTLLYFISVYGKDLDITVEQIIWLDKKGLITMIEGRFSYDFYSNEEDTFSRIVFSAIKDRSKIVLDFNECLKFKNFKKMEIEK